MKMSKLFVQTLREFPSDAEVISHKMLARAGYIRKLTSGVYNFLPLMWRVLKKVENIIREEMDAAGAQELLMPFVQPKELWEESGRWEAYGKELMRLKDRHDRVMCLGPTHEEVITAIARDGLKSYKQMPVNLYQIQSKFRDEVRPRYGLLRGREFIMKDAYSFDLDEAGLDREYENMARAYKRIFDRCGLDTKMVQSDSGAIGGSVSHEFMVITDTDAGENDVFYCENCDYSANSNHAVSNLPDAVVDGKEYFAQTKILDTPNTHSIEELSEFLKIPSTLILKSLVYIVDKKPVIALIRADKAVEETKLMNAAGGIDIRIASSAEIAELMANHGFDAVPGFIGPKGMSDIQIIADETVKDMKNFVVGINETDKHMVGANLEDLCIKDLQYADIRLVERGDFCPQCGKPLCVTRGIEVGNIFTLGYKYADALDLNFNDESGKRQKVFMGSYGIGPSRVMGVIAEMLSDDKGLVWPEEIAPYKYYLVGLGEEGNKKAAELHDKTPELVFFDDRDARAGEKFADAELMGMPYRVVISDKTLANNQVEVMNRKTGETKLLTLDEFEHKLV